MNDNANGAQADGTNGEQKINKVLSKLDLLTERAKSRTSNVFDRPKMVVASSQKEAAPMNPPEEEYLEQEVPNENVANRYKEKEEVERAETMAEKIIPKTPLKLKISTEFTPENMYEQVRKDYTGFIHQSINGCLDALAVFYIQGNRFAESKDLKLFLMKNMQNNISSLKEQYVAKYPLINGLESMISLVEKKEADTFRSIVSDFIGKMNANTFG